MIDEFNAKSLNQSRIFTVTEINKIVKSIINEIDLFKSIQICGEISNLKEAANGHIYFTLKDENSSISAVIFKQYRVNIKQDLNNGDFITAYCGLDFYSSKGSLSLIVYNIKPQGLGDYLVKINELKEKLAKEGLFEESHKRKIDRYAQSIAIITAKNSAAYKDIVFNVFKRNPYVKIYAVYSGVQGKESEDSIVEAVRKANNLPVSTIILGRGGGSTEDLDVFNSEKVVRTIYESKTPIITAIGHEIDYTLSDYASDVRVSTPTGAASAAVIDINELNLQVKTFQTNICKLVDNNIKNIINYLKNTKIILTNTILNSINLLKKDVNYYKEVIETKCPLNILKNGYSITSDLNGKIITSSSQINKGETIKTVLNDGFILSKVE
mgnify:CR=1 FL=1